MKTAALVSSLQLVTSIAAGTPPIFDSVAGARYDSIVGATAAVALSAPFRFVRATVPRRGEAP